MKIFIILSLASLALSAPQYGSGNRPQNQAQNSNNFGGQQTIIEVGRQPQLDPGCRIEYKLINEIEYREEFETKCEQKYRKNCYQEFERVCKPYQDQQCDTIYVNKCQTLRKKNCWEDYRVTKEAYTEDVCQDRPYQECEKHWQTDAGQKVWVDNPSACKTLYKTECNAVQKQRDVRTPYEKCEWNPYEECKDVPEQKCYSVTKENCKNEPYQKCDDVPYQDCQQVHKNVPHQISQKKPVRVCTGKPDYAYSQREIDQFDLGIRSGGDELDIDPKLRDVEEVTTKKAPSAITFG